MEALNREVYWKDWLENIDNLKNKKEAIPINAQLDTSWIVIPGYNGIKIDVIKSLINLEKLGKWDERQIVYEEVEPYVTISDFNPAPIYFGNSNKPMVSFMVNVAWGNEYLSKMLKILYENEVKATFCLDGSWTYKYPLLAQKIKEDGHEIGSHAYSHPDMRGMALENIKWELRETNETIKKELGLTPKLFTPPSGEFDERVVYLAAQEGMYTVLCTIDTMDWNKPDPKEIKERVKKNIRNGALILMHPTESSIEVLTDIIKIVRERGYKLGTVGQLLSTKRV